jgi:hypothetical protein
LLQAASNPVELGRVGLGRLDVSRMFPKFPDAIARSDLDRNSGRGWQLVLIVPVGESAAGIPSIIQAKG